MNENPGAKAGAGDDSEKKLPRLTLAPLRSKASAAKAIDAVLDLLAQTWPDVFPRYERRRRPLKIGIHLEVLARLDGAVTATELAAALAVFTGNHFYQKRCTKVGAPRIGLDGQPAGAITEAESQFAKMRVSALQDDEAPWRKSKPQRVRRPVIKPLRAVEIERRGRLVIERKRRLAKVPGSG